MQDIQELLHLLISRHSAPFQMSSQVPGGTASKVVRPSRSVALFLAGTRGGALATLSDPQLLLFEGLSRAGTGCEQCWPAGHAAPLS